MPPLFRQHKFAQTLEKYPPGRVGAAGVGHRSLLQTNLSLVILLGMLEHSAF